METQRSRATEVGYANVKAPRARCPHGYLADILATRSHGDGYLWGRDVCPTGCRIKGWESAERRVSLDEHPFRALREGADV